VCDENPSTLSTYASLSPGARLERHADDVMSAADVDAILLATPARSHAELAVAALSAGKHVFVEKPMALCHADAERMRVAADAHDRRLMVGHLMLYHPAIVRLRELLQAGVLGNVQSICSQRLGPPQAHRDDGFWWSLAPHDLSIACHLYARSPLHIVARRAVAPGRDLVHAHLEFDANQRATIVVGSVGSEKLRRLTVTGERGTLVFDDACRKAELFHETPRHAPRRVEFEPTEPLECELGHFVDALLDGTPIRSDATEGTHVVRLLEAGARGLDVVDQADSSASWADGGQLAS
jgi:UDP-2-acetamido-3-amino-2,3-dideoxy-glucuronate N-acetyltransferase